MAPKGRSLYGRAWFSCHCGHRFRSTNIPEGRTVWCPRCGLELGPEAKAPQGGPPAWATRMWSGLESIPAPKVEAPALRLEVGDAALASLGDVPGAGVIASPGVLPRYEEDVLDGVAKLEAAFPEFDGKAAWLLWNAGWSVDEEGSLFHCVSGTTIRRVVE